MKQHIMEHENDRVLLEKAAKAAGLVVVGDVDVMVVQPGHFAGGLVHRNDRGGDSLWNPLTDDGDALRLAVKLKLKVYQGEFAAIVHPRMSHSYVGEEYERNGLDPCAATRRAIVRAAAAIGSAA